MGVTDVARVRKVYKLNAVGDGGSKGKRWRKDGSEEASGGVEEGVVVQDGDGKGEREKRELEVAVLGLIALRGAV